MQQAQTIQVFVRLKPPNHNNSTISNDQFNNNNDNIDSNSITINDNNTSVVKVDDTNTIISLLREKKGQSDFQFSKVFSLYSNQKVVYDSCNVINDVLEGINCCIMAYGQTGSGEMCNNVSNIVL